MDRRSFLKNSSLASTSILVPSFLQGVSFGKREASRSGKILVVVQFSGGNDGLNMVVPYQNDIYYRSRPTLAIRKNEVLGLTDELGLNPAMESLKRLFDDGLLTVLNSVGYPNPNRSHFRSMDIWQSGSSGSDYWSDGWLGRYLDSQCAGCDVPHHAIELDASVSLALKGETRNGFAMTNPGQLKKSMSNPFHMELAKHDHDHHESQVAYLYKTMVDTQQSADYIYEKSKTFKTETAYPLSPFGRNLKQISELISSDSDTKIYYLSLGSFDTHANQRNTQARLLKMYADGMKAFVEDLKKANLLDDTLILTFSEFGRRVKQNGSNGTDHGAANNLFLIGGKLNQPGVFNNSPDLSDLINGDIKHTIDFRQVYADILERWLETNSRVVLKESFDRLGLV